MLGHNAGWHGLQGDTYKRLSVVLRPPPRPCRRAPACVLTTFVNGELRAAMRHGQPMGAAERAEFESASTRCPGREVRKDAGAVGIVIRWPEDAPRDRAGLRLRAGGPELVIPPLQAALPRFVALTVLRLATPGLHHGTRYEMVGDQDGTDDQPINA